MSSDRPLERASTALPAALVFDLDGTIVDTETPEFEAIRAVWNRHGREYTIEQFAKYVGTPAGTVGWLDDLLAVAEGPVDIGAAIELRRAVHRQMTDDLEPRAGIVALIEEASAAGVPMAVASNSPAWWVRERLAALELAHHLPVMITIDTATRPKPDPAPYAEACAALGAEPARTVAFEDSSTGVRSAIAAGLYTVACPNALTTAHDLSAAHRLVDAHTEIRLADLAAAVADRS
jgi:putative hydrolase of the HAD superfamily